MTDVQPECDALVEELISLLRNNDVGSNAVIEFLDRHKGIAYIGEIQSVLDIKELLDTGLLR